MFVAAAEVEVFVGDVVAVVAGFVTMVKVDVTRRSVSCSQFLMLRMNLQTALLRGALNFSDLGKDSPGLLLGRH